MSSTRSSLLAALKDPRDESANRHFVEIYGPKIVAGLRKRQLPEAEDIAQDVLARILRRISSQAWQYDPERSFRGYVATCVRNAFYSVMRDRKARVVRAIGGSSAGNRMDQLPDPSSYEGVEDDDSSGKLASLIASDLWREVEQRIRCRVKRQTWDLYRQWKRRKLGKRAPRGNRLAQRLGISKGAVYQASHRVCRMIREEFRKFLSHQGEAGE